MFVRAPVTYMVWFGWWSVRPGHVTGNCGFHSWFMIFSRIAHESYNLIWIIHPTLRSQLGHPLIYRRHISVTVHRDTSQPCYPLTHLSHPTLWHISATLLLDTPQPPYPLTYISHATLWHISATLPSDTSETPYPLTHLSHPTAGHTSTTLPPDIS